MESYGSLAKFANTQRKKMEKEARLAKMTIELKTALGMLTENKQATLAKMTIDLNLIVKQWALDDKITY
jgi:hypothetical protein